MLFVFKLAIRKITLIIQKKKGGKKFIIGSFRREVNYPFTELEI